MFSLDERHEARKSRARVSLSRAKQLAEEKSRVDGSLNVKKLVLFLSFIATRITVLFYNLQNFIKRHIVSH
jgi:hypothetical protein